MLIPVLYAAQYLAVVLGVCTGRSLVGLVNDQVGKAAGCLLAFTCILVGTSAVVSELSGIAVVGQLLGLSSTASCTVAATLLIIIILPGDYRVVERVGLCLGSCLSVFIVVGYLCDPPKAKILEATLTLPPFSVLESPRFR